MAESFLSKPFAPELAESFIAAPVSDSWLHEVKWDGYRIVATIVGGNVRFPSRNAIESTKEVPKLAAAVCSLKLNSVQLDGEMIAPEVGSSDFDVLQGVSAKKQGTAALSPQEDLSMALNELEKRELAQEALTRSLQIAVMALINAIPDKDALRLDFERFMQVTHVSVMESVASEESKAYFQVQLDENLGLLTRNL